jgi:hypothetical protein
MKVESNPGGRLDSTLFVSVVLTFTSSQLRHHWSPGGRLQVDHIFRSVGRHHYKNISILFFPIPFLPINQLYLIMIYHADAISSRNYVVFIDNN